MPLYVCPGASAADVFDEFMGAEFDYYHRGILCLCDSASSDKHPDTKEASEIGLQAENHSVKNDVPTIHTDYKSKARCRILKFRTLYFYDLGNL